MNSDGQREIVVVGGTDNAHTRLNSVEIFNVDTGVWREGEEATLIIVYKGQHCV